MTMKVIGLTDCLIGGTHLPRLYVIKEDDWQLPLLPLLYSVYTTLYGTVYEMFSDAHQSEHSSHPHFTERYVTDNTIRTYIYCLAKFFDHLKLTTGGSSYTVSDFTVSHYLNNELPTRNISRCSTMTHRAAITSYCNFLTYFGLSPYIKLRLYRKTIQLIESNNSTPFHINYISSSNRTQLLMACKTLAEKLIIRLGYEVGLRTSEVAGLCLQGKDELISLFQKLNSSTYANQDYFSYWLKGRYTKRGRSRWIYFSRELLTDMERYYKSERKLLLQSTDIDPDNLFLRTDKRFCGTAVGKEYASRIFHRRAMAAGLSPVLSFHDLRHTFATELYHQELTGHSGRETRSESAALLVVAQRLGHKLSRNGTPQATTVRYIRMRLEMLEVENGSS
ncbi:tyrosine-type recombinase/integrase [Enterobacter kobei]|uniref:tyrosine-type recombinase/integrase n=1 Tax=Enterobacter kobei TaxID=208224 RepID=UPI003CEFFCD9